MFKKPLLFLLTLSLFALLAACGGNAISFEDGGVTVNVSLTEEMIQGMVGNGNVTVNNEALFTEVTAVNFNEGVINIEVTFLTPCGNSGEGFIFMAFSAVDGRLNVEITDHSLDGLGDKIDEANQELAEAFAQQATQEENVRFTDVSVTDDALNMTIQVSFE